MKIFVKAKPDAWENLVEKVDETHYVVSVKEPPIDGRANYAIIKLLAKHFNVSPLQVKLVSGFSSRQKVFEIKY